MPHGANLTLCHQKEIGLRKDSSIICRYNVGFVVAHCQEYGFHAAISATLVHDAEIAISLSILSGFTILEPAQQEECEYGQLRLEVLSDFDFSCNLTGCTSKSCSRARMRVAATKRGIYSESGCLTVQT